MTALERQHSDWVGTALPPAAAALATITSASALTGVISGWSWFSYVVVAVVLVSCTGLALRSLRLPPAAVGLSQLAVLFLLITGMFTTEGILAVIPGPSALGELGDVLATAGSQIKTGLPPVDATPPILCLVTIGIGMVAILVDTLAVAVAAPAASGLVLLCLYAVPASLADELLPWWTFALGATAFAGLMAVDGNHRHRAWRGRGTSVGRSPEAASAPSAVVVIALSLGLFVGATFTAIGTVGQLPGQTPGESKSYRGGLGINPFTSMRGLLTDRGTTEVFRVRGLDGQRRLLRAFTLDTYDASETWKLDQRMRAGVPANGALPRSLGDNGGRAVSPIRIEPVNWKDHWVPVYGHPRDIAGIDDSWFYDNVSGTVYSTSAQRPPAYTLTAVLPDPTAKQLRQADVDTSGLPAEYTRISGIDDRVRRLTDKITDGERSRFDKAQALYQHLTGDGGFIYDTKTAPRSDDNALADFLINGKRGYCEQFASSMAVMLRLEGIPSRIAIGFTAGTQVGDYTSITTRDAHAWVEVYFGEKYGWVPFDPTPLADGRGADQPHLESTGPDAGGPNPADDLDNQRQAPNEQDPVGVEPDAPDAGSGEQTSLAQAPGWARWATLPFMLIAVLLSAATVLVARRTSELRTRAELAEDAEKLSIARQWLPIATAGAWLVCVWLVGWMASWWIALALLVVVGALAAPAMSREVQRGRRLHAVTMREPSAPDAAWHELIDECADREAPISSSDTVRASARRLAADHQLDDEGKEHLRTVVGVLERSWYGGGEVTDERFAAAFEGLRQSLNRGAPLSVRAKLLPRSILNRRHTWNSGPFAKRK